MPLQMRLSAKESILVTDMTTGKVVALLTVTEARAGWANLCLRANPEIRFIRTDLDGRPAGAHAD